MRVAVVVESLWGNTRRVAEAIAEGARDAGADAVVVALGETAEPPADVDLLVAGGPTHVHGMTSARTRRGAAADAGAKGLPAPDVGGAPLREWLAGPGHPLAPRAAAFDTRIGLSTLLTGSAAKGIAKRLRGLGYDLAGRESFIVDDTDGPLHEGELERARAWGAALAGVRGASR
jgi:hypothetical protein